MSETVVKPFKVRGQIEERDYKLASRTVFFGNSKLAIESKLNVTTKVRGQIDVLR